MKRSNAHCFHVFDPDRPRRKPRDVIFLFDHHIGRREARRIVTKVDGYKIRRKKKIS